LLYDAHQNNKCSPVLDSSLAYMVTVTIDKNLGKENCGYTNENNTKFVYYTTKHKTWKHETCHRATPNGFPVDFQVKNTPPVHPFTVQRFKSWNLLVICASINRFNAKLIMSKLGYNWRHLKLIQSVWGGESESKPITKRSDFSSPACVMKTS